MNRPLTHTDPHRSVVYLAFLVPLTAAAFLPGITGGYLLDDYVNLLGNAALRLGPGATWNDWWEAITSGESSSLGRPLTMLTFAINARLAGFDPLAWKLTSLALHVVNSALTFVLLRQLQLLSMDKEDARSVSPLWAWIVALVWAIHPLQVSTVLYLVQRMEVLGHTAILLSALSYLRGRVSLMRSRSGWRWIAFAGLIGGLGVLAKESAALGVFFLVLIETLVLRGRCADPADEQRLRLGVCLVTGLAGAAVIAISVLGAGDIPYASREFTMVERLLTQPRVLCSYLQWIILPLPDALTFYHDNYPVSKGLWSPPTTLFAMTALSAGLALVWTQRRRVPLLSVGVGWFFAAHMLTSGPLPLELVFEHRNYGALLGAVLAIGSLAPGRRSPSQVRSRAGHLLATGGVCAMLALSMVRSYQWRDPLVLARDLAAKAPQSARAAHNLGVLLANPLPNPQDLDGALRELERAGRLPNGGALSDQLQIELRSRHGKPIPPMLWSRLKSALSENVFDQNAADAVYGLVRCQLQSVCNLDTPELTIVLSAAASRGGARFPDVLLAVADYVWQVHGDGVLATKLLSDAVRARPQAVEYRLAYASLLVALEKTAQAEAELAEAARLDEGGRYRSAIISIRDSLTR